MTAEVEQNQSHAKKISQSRPTHAGEARAAAACRMLMVPELFFVFSDERGVRCLGDTPASRVSEIAHAQ